MTPRLTRSAPGPRPRGVCRAGAPEKRPGLLGERKQPFDCPTGPSEGLFRQAIETSRTRLLIAGAMMALAFTAVGARTVDLGLLRGPNEPRVARAVQTAKPIATERADILDRNGEVLATSLRTVSLYANTQRILDPREAAASLTRVFPDLDPQTLLARLESGRSFVWIKRHLTPAQQFAVNALGLPGFDFQQEETRVYPHGRLVSHVLGYTDIDNNGLSAIEKTFDASMKASSEPLALSLDLRIQHLVREELQRAIDTYSAIGGAAVVTKARTGEVLALVSLPDFDPNDPAGAGEEARFNRATLGIYELGSVFKIFNTAMALEAGTTSLADGYDASEPIRVGRFAIRDFKPKNRYLSVPEIFMYSSNIGSAKMALDVGGPGQRAFLERLGLLDLAGIELPERGAPQYPDVWRPVNTMTIAFGHGIAVSPLHLASAVGAMVNGGWSVRPTLLKTDGRPNGAVRVIGADTSRAVRQLMRAMVEGGTGGRADAPGYLVGGKTGTAEKPNAAGGYDRRARISSFVGAFPMHAPEYVVYAVLDEPQGTEETFGYATGGWVAAPVVKAVVERMAPLVGMRPFNAEAPEIRQDLAMEVPQGTPRLAAYRP